MSNSNNESDSEKSNLGNANHSSNISQEEETEFTLDDIFVNLTLISRIEVGNKLIRNNKHVNIDTSYFPSITRWLYGQNHIDILKFINTILNKAFEYNDILTKDKNEESRQNLIRLNNILSNVINGLSNLMQTYHYDKLTQSSIEVMINTIRNKLNLQLKHIHYVYDENMIKHNNLSSSFHVDETEQSDDRLENNNSKLSNSREIISSSITKDNKENKENRDIKEYKVHKEDDTDIHRVQSNNPHPKKKKFHT